MGSDKEYMDDKSRHVLKSIKSGNVPFRTLIRELSCPFCSKRVNPRMDSMIQHTVGIGESPNASLKPAITAKDAVYGKFLREYIRTSLVSPSFRIGIRRSKPAKK